MVSLYPPNYALVPILNLEYTEIFEIIKKGNSETFNKRISKFLEKYNDCIGIDYDSFPYIKRLKSRITKYRKENPDKTISTDEEIEKGINFLKNVLSNNTENGTFFSDYIKNARLIRKTNKNKYKQLKTSFVTYTPFGTFKTRESSSFIKPSGFLYFDIDSKFTKSESINILSFLKEDKYIYKSWLSFSGKGIGFVVKSKWSNEIELKKTYYKLLEYFTLKLKNNYNFDRRLFDSQVCNINRMNVLSFGIISENDDSCNFDYEEYEDSLYNLLHSIYKTNSLLEIPDRTMNISDVVVNRQVTHSNTISEMDEDKTIRFLEILTKKLSFIGSEDYNSSIHNYIKYVYRFNINEYYVKQYLFDKIPLTDKTQRTFDSIWKYYSKFENFMSIYPNM